MCTWGTQGLSTPVDQGTRTETEVCLRGAGMQWRKTYLNSKFSEHLISSKDKDYLVLLVELNILDIHMLQLYSFLTPVAF